MLCSQLVCVMRYAFSGHLIHIPHIVPFCYHSIHSHICILWIVVGRYSWATAKDSTPSIACPEICSTQTLQSRQESPWCIAPYNGDQVHLGGSGSQRLNPSIAIYSLWVFLGFRSGSSFNLSLPMNPNGSQSSCILTSCWLIGRPTCLSLWSIRRAFYVRFQVVILMTSSPDCEVYPHCLHQEV